MKTLYLSEAHKDRLINGAVLLAFLLLLLNVLYPPQVSRGGDVGRSDYQSQPLAPLKEAQLSTLAEIETLALPNSGTTTSAGSTANSAPASDSAMQNSSTATATIPTTRSPYSQDQSWLRQRLARLVNGSVDVPESLLLNKKSLF